MNTRQWLATTLMALAGLTLAPGNVGAGEALKAKKFHFGTHPARTNITFVSEADIETIHGVGHEMSGVLTVDAQGKSVTGSLSIPVASLRTGIALRDEHLRSDAWLDEKKFPSIGLRLVSATENKKNPKIWDYAADLTIKGVTKRIRGTTRVSAIPDRFSASLGGGSWVRVRAAFDVVLGDFGIVVPQTVGAKVSTTWKIGIDLYGTTSAPKPKSKSK